VKGGAGAEEGRSGVAEGGVDSVVGAGGVDQGLVSSQDYMAQVLCRIERGEIVLRTCVVEGPSGIRKVPEEVLEKQLEELLGKALEENPEKDVDEHPEK